MNRNERMNLFTMFSSILSKKYTQFAKKCFLMLSVQSELHSNMKPIGRRVAGKVHTSKVSMIKI